MQVKVDVFACNDINRSRINVQLIPIGTLSQTREAIAVASAGNKILFAGAGGWYSSVDIYKITTSSWSTAELSIARVIQQLLLPEARYFLAEVRSAMEPFRQTM